MPGKALTRITSRFVFLLVFYSFLVVAPSRASSASGAEIGQKVGEGTVATFRGLGQAIAWTGKWTYRSIAFLVEEALRPITPITHKMAELFGTKTVESESH